MKNLYFILLLFAIKFPLFNQCSHCWVKDRELIQGDGRLIYKKSKFFDSLRHIQGRDIENSIRDSSRYYWFLQACYDFSGRFFEVPKEYKVQGYLKPTYKQAVYNSEQQYYLIPPSVSKNSNFYNMPPGDSMDVYYIQAMDIAYDSCWEFLFRRDYDILINGDKTNIKEKYPYCIHFDTILNSYYSTFGGAMSGYYQLYPAIKKRYAWLNNLSKQEVDSLLKYEYQQYFKIRRITIKKLICNFEITFFKDIIFRKSETYSLSELLYMVNTGVCKFSWKKEFTHFSHLRVYPYLLKIPQTFMENFEFYANYLCEKEDNAKYYPLKKQVTLKALNEIPAFGGYIIFSFPNGLKKIKQMYYMPAATLSKPYLYQEIWDYENSNFWAKHFRPELYFDFNVKAKREWRKGDALSIQRANIALDR